MHHNILHNKSRNDLTEYIENYRRYNPNLFDCYVGIKPPSLSNIAVMLFCRVINNRRYDEKNRGAESKRIYSNLYFSMGDLLEYYDPIKYSSTELSMSYDSDNFSKKLDKLCDMNVFYQWEYKKPYSRIFVIERDIAVWKYYNTKGCVIPRTILKIINLADAMIEDMIKIEGRRGRKPDKYDIRNSFGFFVDGMVKKMNPNVFKGLPLWSGVGDVFTYLKTLKKEIKNIDGFAGLEEDEDFINKLPPSARENLHKNELLEERKMNTKEQIASSVENEIVPKNSNIVNKIKHRKKRVRKTKTTTTSSEISPILQTFDGVDPFNNPRDFIKFYRVIVTSRKEDAIFPKYESEGHTAAVIMDLLKDSGFWGDKNFLINWIWYYVDTRLKGDHHRKIEKTSLDALKDSFDDYCQRQST